MRELVLNFPKDTKSIEQVRTTLGDKAVNRLVEHLKSRKKDMSYHFRKDGWNLNYRFILSDAIIALVGADLFLYVAQQLMPKNVRLVFKDNEILFIKEELLNDNETIGKKVKSSRKRNKKHLRSRTHAKKRVHKR